MFTFSRRSLQTTKRKKKNIKKSLFLSNNMVQDVFPHPILLCVGQKKNVEEVNSEQFLLYLKYK